MVRLLKKSLGQGSKDKGDLATVSTPKISAGNCGVTLRVLLKNPIADGFFNVPMLLSRDEILSNYFTKR